MSHIIIERSPLEKLLFANTKTAAVWLVVRVYVGWAWLSAGLHKVGEAAWTGDQAGVALSGFVNGALAKATGEHPDVQGWYATFLEEVVLPNADVFSHMVAWGEVLVGIALIIGAFVGIAAFFGLLMNLNFLLAGAVSSNPVLFTLAILLILAWKVAGWWGVDRYLLPKLGAPWQPGPVRISS